MGILVQEMTTEFLLASEFEFMMNFNHESINILNSEVGRTKIISRKCNTDSEGGSFSSFSVPHNGFFP